MALLNQCDQCRISLTYCLPFCFLPLAVHDSKHILFALAWFHITHKYTKTCLVTDHSLLHFRFCYPRDKEQVLTQNGKVEDQPLPQGTNTLARTARTLVQHDVTLSDLAWPGRWVFVSKFLLVMTKKYAFLSDRSTYCLCINLIAKLTDLIPFSSKDRSVSSTDNSNQLRELTCRLNETEKTDALEWQITDQSGWRIGYNLTYQDKIWPIRIFTFIWWT